MLWKTFNSGAEFPAKYWLLSARRLLLLSQTPVLAAVVCYSQAKQGSIPVPFKHCCSQLHTRSSALGSAAPTWAAAGGRQALVNADEITHRLHCHKNQHDACASLSVPPGPRGATRDKKELDGRQQLFHTLL